MKVEFHRHAMGEEEKAAVAAVLDGLFLTTGEEVYAFEREFADYLGVPFVVTVASCTSALHLALLALGVGPGDEVITTPMSFVASATPIIHAGASPVFVDVEPDTGLLDPARVRAAITPATRAIVAVHLYGTMCDMVALRRIADERGLVLIEDAAHCIEGSRGGVRAAHLGDAACFSFYATKTLTSGEGGAIAVQDEGLALRLRRLRLHGIDRGPAERHGKPYQHWDMLELGHKSNMTNIQAALLRPQLKRLEERHRRRETLAVMYDRFVEGAPWLTRPSVPTDARSGRHLYTVWTEPHRRDALLAFLGANGIGCAVNYRAMTDLSWFRKNVRNRFDLGHAERIGASTVSLPFHSVLADDEVQSVCEVLERAHTSLR